MSLKALICRNVKLFFRDKGMFFTSMVTPLILLFLFVTFLGNVYRDSMLSGLPSGFSIPGELVDGFVGSWLFSSLLAVSCVTVAFCSNLLMVQDKALGTRADLTIAPIKQTTLAFSYFIATAITTLTICAVTLCAGFAYLRCVGWYMSNMDVLLTITDAFLLAILGTAMSSVVSHFLSTQAQMSAISVIMSACYGFLCGAYMPVSTFGEGIRNFVSCLPGTYGTVLMRNHVMGGAVRELAAINLPREALNALRVAFDSDLYFFGNKVETPILYIVLIGSIFALLAAYALLSRRSGIKK